MKAIIISQEKLEEILEETRKNLELTKFRNLEGTLKEKQLISQMHRHYNYYVVDMIRKIENS